MSFLAPLFVLGALAVAAPVIFHLIRRTSRDKTPFSSLMFLQPTPPRVTRKSRLENILLLILRCAVLCLLALAFARPFFRNPLLGSSNKGAVTRTVILLDTSASMRRDSLWPDAVDKALELVRKAAPAEQIAILGFDRNATTALPFRDWNDASAGERRVRAEQRLRTLKPTWNSTHLGNALIAANETFEAERENATAPRHVVVISDMQEGTRLEGLQGLPWPRQTHVTLVTVKAKRAGNAGAQLLAQAATTVQATESIRVRVHNSADSKREQFHLQWSGSASNPVALYVPPGQNRMLDLPRAVGSDTLTLTGDEEDFDNQLHVVTPPREKIEVAFVGNDDETNTANLLFYLQRAFPETARQEVHIRPVKPDGDLAGAMRNASLVVLAGALPADALRAAANALTNGATVLCALRTPAEADTVTQLTGYKVTADEARGAAYQMLTEIDFSHPLFASFADARFSDFTKIHFWKHRRVDFGTTNAHLLARFDNGDPAIAQFMTGKGTLFVLTAGWQPADSQLALSSKFVPLLYALLEIGGAMKAQAMAFNVGEAVDLTPLHATNALTVRKPDGTTAAVPAGAKVFSGTELPGVHVVTGTEPPFRFAVNIAGEESRTAPLAIESLEQLGVPVRVAPVGTVEQIARREAQLKATELENHQKLWRWIIALALVIVIAETWVAARLSRRSPAAA